MRPVVVVGLCLGLAACNGNGGNPIKLDPIQLALGTVVSAEIGARVVIGNKDCPPGMDDPVEVLKHFCSTEKMKRGANLGLPILQAAEATIRGFVGSSDPAVIDKVQAIANKALDDFQKAGG